MKFLIIDGNSIMNRAYYGVKSQMSSFPNNALVGFISIFIKIFTSENPTHTAVTFDVHHPTFRHEMYPEYKATRHSHPEDLISQIDLIKPILRAMGVAVVEKAGYEGDDIIGTLSRIASENDVNSLIVTGDRDMFQLVDDHVTVLLKSNKGDIICNKQQVMAAYSGIEPHRLIDVKAIMGDKSDNIPGVPGIGEKGAVELIKRYETLDFIYENVNNLGIAGSLKDKLIKGKDSAILSRKLAEINRHAPISENLDDYINQKEDWDEITRLLTELEMPVTLHHLKHTFMY